MEIRYIAQPNEQIGSVLLELLASRPEEVIIASAFVSLQTLLRLRSIVNQLSINGSVVKMIVGVDLGGTSKEALREMASWKIPITIVKNSSVGHTFHPKLYFLKWEDRAAIIVGSSNLTEGGWFKNYEVNTVVRYSLPEELDLYENAKQDLNRFLEPAGPTARLLDDLYLAILVARNDIPTEQEARERTREGAKSGRVENNRDNAFGTERFPPPPPMPADVIAEILENTVNRRRDGQERAPDEEVSPTVITPMSFYMTLPKLQGDNIPGEARIPLHAVEMAPDFWGWPDEYDTQRSPRGGSERVYHNWKPVWRISIADNSDRSNTLAVRMYMYDNSSDFRFYARPLVDAGGDLGDIVQITRVGRPDVEFECVLAKQGTAAHRDWSQYCTVKIRNSTRTFGYA